ncbi:MAG TPA: hypothetical protein VMU28_00085 [Terriglobales bacterium]|nr:hypothetical protein [Terriglobales bacterium]
MARRDTLLAAMPATGVNPEVGLVGTVDTVPGPGVIGDTGAAAPLVTGNVVPFVVVEEMEVPVGKVSTVPAPGVIGVTGAAAPLVMGSVDPIPLVVVVVVVPVIPVTPVVVPSVPGVVATVPGVAKPVPELVAVVTPVTPAVPAAPLMPVVVPVPLVVVPVGVVIKVVPFPPQAVCDAYSSRSAAEPSSNVSKDTLGRRGKTQRMTAPQT